MKINFLRSVLRDPDPGGTGGGGAGQGDGGAGGGGTATTSWIDTLPAEIKTAIPADYVKDPNVTKYKDLPEFIKGHVNVTKLVGEKGVIVPKENATPEEKEKFYNALGRPEKPDGYKLSTIEGLHKDIQVTPETTAVYNSLSHKLGLTNEQADGMNKFLMQAVNQLTIDTEKREQAAMQAAETALRSEWKGEYEGKIANITKQIIKIGGQEWVDTLGGEKGLGNNPVFLKNMDKVLSLLSEDQLAKIGGTGNNSGGGATLTPQEAKSKIDAMMSDSTDAIHDQNHKDHKARVEERMRLYSIAYPDGS